MHYHCEIWIPEKENVIAKVEEILEPFCEENRWYFEDDEDCDVDPDKGERGYWMNPDG